MLVQGKLKNNMWESKDGGKRKETVVKADGVYLAPDNRVSGLHVIKEPAQGFLEAPPTTSASTSPTTMTFHFNDYGEESVSDGRAI